MRNDINIRKAELSDAESLLSIYAPYVEDTAISFEYDVPSVDEFRQRINDISKNYPYIIAEKDGEIVGYAYAGVFKAREAYRHCVETTIYIKEDSRESGIGRILYTALEDELKQRGYINLNACIAWLDTPNEHLTHQSPLFHEKLGYKKVAHFHRCGYKFGEWYDMIWMEKLLN